MRVEQGHELRELSKLGSLGEVHMTGPGSRFHEVAAGTVELLDDPADLVVLNGLISWRAQLSATERAALDAMTAWPYEVVTDNRVAVGAMVVPVPPGFDAGTGRAPSLDLLVDPIDDRTIPDQDAILAIGASLSWLVATLGDTDIAHGGLDPDDILWRTSPGGVFVTAWTGASIDGEFVAAPRNSREWPAGAADPVESDRIALAGAGGWLARRFVESGGDPGHPVVAYASSSVPPRPIEWLSAFSTPSGSSSEPTAPRSAPIAGTPAEVVVDQVVTIADTTAGSRSRIWLATAIVAVALVVAGVVIVALTRSSEDSTGVVATAADRTDGGADEGAVSEDEEAREESARDNESPGGDDPEPSPSTIEVTATSIATTTTTTTTTSTTAPLAAYPRNAIIDPPAANIRAEPGLGATLLGTTAGSGAPVVVLGPMQNHWFEIQWAEGTGWIFGAFVVPPDPGWIVAHDEVRDQIEFLDADGNPSGVASGTGRWVLVSDATGPLWQVVLPEGGLGYVDPAYFVIRS